ncbi:hypothetical protein BrE312_1094 [Brenneria sp. EniD312]|nr:hypothetical protein BrE312_1094 [Brenneria sp. EniD312]
MADLSLPATFQAVASDVENRSRRFFMADLSLPAKLHK